MVSRRLKQLASLSLELPKTPCTKKTVQQQNNTICTSMNYKYTVPQGGLRFSFCCKYFLLYLISFRLILAFSSGLRFSCSSIFLGKLNVYILLKKTAYYKGYIISVTMIL